MCRAPNNNSTDLTNHALKAVTDLVEHDQILLECRIDSSWKSHTRWVGYLDKDFKDVAHAAEMYAHGEINTSS